MATINPVLSSATLSAQNQVHNPLMPKEALEMNAQTSGSQTAAGNSTVTLSEEAQQLDAYLNTATEKVVRDVKDAENQGLESQQTDAGLTYSAIQNSTT